MGKRKRSSQPNNLDLPSSSDDMPCSSGTELLSKKQSLNLDAGVDVGDNSVKLLNSNSSVANRQYNLGRSIFLKRSRHYYGHHYSRRNSGSLANASTSHGKFSPLHDDRLPFKFAHYSPESGRHGEGREKAFSRPERIMSSSLVMDAVSLDKVKIVCGICQKHLKRKPYLLGNALASGEFSVVAVLVCGHVYHADCLEERTSLEDRRDPPCPLCSGSLLQV
ncbi:RING/U-box superfamily protein, putative [Theobroma cacao]|uniref:RING/U-box superfamily protein, putative n=1 Tax=Theobroma cacao TaxID=3641 RepID=A0A061GPA7_THECC|nr:RING/U-box superfamily protein, putative [Theobroma cacao]